MGLSWVSWVLKICDLGFSWVSWLNFEKISAGYSWVRWVSKKHELELAGLARFEKVKLDFNWVFWVSTYNSKKYTVGF